MSTIQLYLPNADYYLYFNSQSYKKDKEDRLKVFVWTNDAVLNNLSDDLIAQFEAKGKCIYDEIESPGESEEVLPENGNKINYLLLNLAERMFILLSSIKMKTKVWSL